MSLYPSWATNRGQPAAMSTRHPENTPVPGVLIVRIDAQVYYANAMTVRDQVKAMITEMEPPPRAVIFDAGAQDEMDVTSTEVIKGLMNKLQGKGIEVYLADIHAPVLEVGSKAGLREIIGEEHVFLTVDSAVRSIERTG